MTVAPNLSEPLFPPHRVPSPPSLTHLALHPFLDPPSFPSYTCFLFTWVEHVENWIPNFPSQTCLSSCIFTSVHDTLSHPLIPARRLNVIHSSLTAPPASHFQSTYWALSSAYYHLNRLVCPILSTPTVTAWVETLIISLQNSCICSLIKFSALQPHLFSAWGGWSDQNANLNMPFPQGRHGVDMVKAA